MYPLSYCPHHLLVGEIAKSIDGDRPCQTDSESLPESGEPALRVYFFRALDCGSKLGVFHRLTLDNRLDSINRITGDPEGDPAETTENEWQNSENRAIRVHLVLD